MAVKDQFEIEALLSYSSSYTDYIFSPGSIFNGERLIIYSNANLDVTARTLPDGFSINNIRKLSAIFGRGFRLGRFDNTFPGLGAEPNHSSSAVSEENIVSPSVNVLLKLRDPTEQFADTVLPRPPDIALKNGASFTEGISEFIYPGSFFMKDDASHNLTGSGAEASRQPKKFVITLGSHGVASLTSSSDASQVSDNVWAHSFPFENKYADLQRVLKPSFDKTYTVTKEQVLASDITTQFHSGAVDLFVQDHRHTSFDSNLYTLQYCFETVGDESLRDAKYNNRRRYVKLINLPTETSGGIFKPTGSIQYPSIEFIYKGFYGFYKRNNDFPPYQSSLENTSSVIPDKPGPTITLKGIGDMRFNGFGRTDPNGRLKNQANWPIYDAVAGYTTFGIFTSSIVFDNYMAVEDFNAVFLRINGWKYGVYSAQPEKTFVYWRRNRFGQMRDMLEQRPFTKLYNTRTGQPLQAAVNISFVSGTSAFLTSSDRNLNERDSGMFDTEGKSGRPFEDRAAED